MTTRRPNLTARRLRAIVEACRAAAAGDPSEGDLEGSGVTADDLSAAADWAEAELDRRGHSRRNPEET